MKIQKANTNEQVLADVTTRRSGLYESRGVAREVGDMGEMSPRHGLKKMLAPELQTDDCG